MTSTELKQTYVSGCPQAAMTATSMVMRQCFLHVFLTGFLALPLPCLDAEPRKFDRLTFHRAPSPLAKEAVTSDWLRFNGPSDNAATPERPLLKKWGSGSPVLLWSATKGEGYASPSIKGDRLVLFHRLDGKEMAECLHPESGKLYWRHEYPVDYSDRYGYSSGPRASAVIDGGRVFIHGVTAWLRCLDLQSGELIWKRDLAKEFSIPTYFFGKGSNPIVSGRNLIVNVGGSSERCVVAFDKKNGKTSWVAKDSWGASYSSPVLMPMHGREVCLVFTGGESRPAKGGLLVIDPADGKKLARFPWRADLYESANAVPPVPVGDNRVFLSECYGVGGVMLEFDKDFKPKVAWVKEDFNIHWMTPILSEGHLYGVAGRHQRGAEMVCLNADTGKELWRERISWQQKVQERTLQLEAFRASILKADGNYLCLSELGSLLWLDMSPKGHRILASSQLFFSSGTWTLPVVSRGLLYVMQNEVDHLTRSPARILCYDLRGK